MSFLGGGSRPARVEGTGTAWVSLSIDNQGNQLLVHVEQASYVGRDERRPDLYVQLLVGHHKEETRSQKNAQVISINETKRLPNIPGETLVVRLKDKDFGKDDTFMEERIPISSLPQGRSQHQLPRGHQGGGYAQGGYGYGHQYQQPQQPIWPHVLPDAPVSTYFVGYTEAPVQRRPMSPMRGQSPLYRSASPTMGMQAPAPLVGNSYNPFPAHAPYGAPLGPAQTGWGYGNQYGGYGGGGYGYGGYGGGYSPTYGGGYSPQRTMSY